MLQTEADLLRTLRSGTYTLAELYALCEAAVDVSRENGRSPVSDRHRTDSVWKHRVRGWLANAKAKGLAERVDRATWLIQGTIENPSRLVLLNAGGDLAGVEMRVQDAVELLHSVEEPVDLVLCDPPYALGRGRGHFADGNGYRRDPGKVLDGYVDVDPSAYAEFSYRWISAAAAILRNGGQLAIVTGPQQACHVQYAAEQAGLTWVSQIVARKVFPLLTSRRPSCAHWCVTVMCRGPLTNPKRVFHPPTGPAQGGVRRRLSARLVGGERPGGPARAPALRQRAPAPARLAPRRRLLGCRGAGRRPYARIRHHRDRRAPRRPPVHRRGPEPRGRPLRRRSTPRRAPLAQLAPARAVRRLRTAPGKRDTGRPATATPPARRSPTPLGDVTGLTVPGRSRPGRY
jgi:hypothetical protein